MIYYCSLLCEMKSTYENNLALSLSNIVAHALTLSRSLLHLIGWVFFRSLGSLCFVEMKVSLIRVARERLFDLFQQF